VKRWGCLAATVAVLVLLACAGIAVPAEAAFFLVAGWAFFLSKVIPQLTVSWPGVATAVVSLAVFVAGIHRLGMWWSAAARSRRRSSAHSIWKSRADADCNGRRLAVVYSRRSSGPRIGCLMATSEQPL
jgi:hypothetical protein